MREKSVSPDDVLREQSKLETAGAPVIQVPIPKRMSRELEQHRPFWLLAWQDYPHTLLSVAHARELNKHVCWLETQFIVQAERVEQLERALKISQVIIP